MPTKSELCLKCLKCCKLLSFTLEALPTTIEFYKARGVQITYNLDKSITVTFPHTCSKLTKYGCSIYKQRPFSCRVFDGRKHLTTKDFCLWEKEI
jgi:Fe-S-cluster containining protein